MEIIDRTMKTISGITDPSAVVEAYWDGIGDLWPIDDYVSVSRRNVEAPFYLITRSSRFTEHLDPWTQRDRLPKLSGGLLGEIAYANKPFIIQDLPSRVAADDPAKFYLEGFSALVALPQYDNGESLNVTGLLVPMGVELDPSIFPFMHWQSSLFGRGTQNLVLKNQLAGALASLDKELQVVGEIQKSLLPQTLPTIPGFDIAAYYQTSARAGGDYYDFFPLHDGKWGLFIADVSGHGTPAAVVMAITHAIAHAQPGTHTPPMQLLNYLNDQLARLYTKDGTFVTAFYAVLDPVARTLTFSSAGHNPPRLARGKGVIALKESSQLPLGIMEGQDFNQTTVTLDPGDVLLLYTDGITEAMAPRNAAGSRELFGTSRLDEVLLHCGQPSATQWIEKVRKSVAKFSENAPPSDDQTLIAIRCV